MKILFINALYAPNQFGGAERVVQSLAEGLVEAGHQVVVVSTEPQKRTRVAWINGVKVYYVGLSNVYWPYGQVNHKVLKPIWHALDTYNPRMANKVRRILDIECPDVVNTSTMVGFSVSVCRPVKQRHLPWIHTLQDYYLLCPRSSMFRNGENCEKRCAKCRLYAEPRHYLSNQADVVIGASQLTLNRHLKFGYFSATPQQEVIYNAHHIHCNSLPLAERSSPIRFGYLGRIDPTKGVEVLLQSARQLPEDAYSLDIGGRLTATYGSSLRAKYEAPTIRFLGHVTPEAFFSQIDVLVVPSLWHDPSPRVINEAYTRGVPVIGSSRGGIPELIDNERTGYIFDPASPGDLAAKMRRCIREPTVINRMQTACLEKAKDFRPERIIGQYLEVYYKAIKNT